MEMWTGFRSSGGGGGGGDGLNSNLMGVAVDDKQR